MVKSVLYNSEKYVPNAWAQILAKYGGAGGKVDEIHRSEDQRNVILHFGEPLGRTTVQILDATINLDYIISGESEETDIKITKSALEEMFNVKLIKEMEVKTI